MSYMATKAQVKALGILSRVKKPVPLDTFTKRMWDGSVAKNFAKHFLAGLISSNYVKKAGTKDAETYSITPEGSTILTKPEWRCMYCGLEFFEMPKRPSPKDCQRCGSLHSICKSCFKVQVIVGGKWPSWKPVLRDCPKKENKRRAQAIKIVKK